MAEAKIILRAEDKASPDIKKVNDSVSGLKGSLESISSFGTKLTGVGNALTVGLTGPIVAAGSALAAMTMQVAGSADQIDKMSERTGISRQSLQELRYAAEQTGVDFNGLDGVFAGFAARLNTELIGGTSAAAEGFAALGVATEDAEGKMRSSGDIIEDTMAAIADIEDPAERSAAALTVFGAEGAKLLPLLNQGSEGIENLRQRANELGLVLEDETIAILVTLGDKVADAKAAFSGLANGIVQEFAPIIEEEVIPLITQELIPAIQDIAEKVADVIRWYADLDESHRNIINAAVLVVAGIGPLLSVFGRLLTAIDLASKAFVGLKAAALLATGPTGWAILAVAAVGVLALALAGNRGGDGEISLESAAKKAEEAAGKVDGYNTLDSAVGTLANSLDGPVKTAFENSVTRIYGVLNAAKDVQLELYKIALGTDILDQLMSGDLRDTFRELQAGVYTDGRPTVIQQLTDALLEGNFPEAIRILELELVSFENSADETGRNLILNLRNRLVEAERLAARYAAVRSGPDFGNLTGTQYDVPGAPAPAPAPASAPSPEPTVPVTTEPVEPPRASIPVPAATVPIEIDYELPTASEVIRQAELEALASDVGDEIESRPGFIIPTPIVPEPTLDYEFPSIVDEALRGITTEVEGRELEPIEKILEIDIPVPVMVEPDLETYDFPGVADSVFDTIRNTFEGKEIEPVGVTSVIDYRAEAQAREELLAATEALTSAEAYAQEQRQEEQMAAQERLATIREQNEAASEAIEYANFIRNMEDEARAASSAVGEFYSIFFTNSVTEKVQGQLSAIRSEVALLERGLMEAAFAARESGDWTAYEIVLERLQEVNEELRDYETLLSAAQRVDAFRENAREASGFSSEMSAVSLELSRYNQLVAELESAALSTLSEREQAVYMAMDAEALRLQILQKEGAITREQEEELAKLLNTMRELMAVGEGNLTEEQRDQLTLLRRAASEAGIELEDLKEQLKLDKETQAWKDLQQIVRGGVDIIGDAMREFGASDEVIESFNQIGTAVDDAFGAATSFASGDIIGGVIKTAKAIFGVFKWLANLFKSDAQRLAEQIAEIVKAISGQIASSIQSSMTAAFSEWAKSSESTRSINELKEKMRTSIREAVFDGLVEAIIQASLMEAVLAPLIEAAVAAFQSGDFGAFEAALADIERGTDQFFTDYQEQIEYLGEWGREFADATNDVAENIPDPEKYEPLYDRITEATSGFGTFVSQAVSIPLYDAARIFTQGVDKFGMYVNRLVDDGIRVHSTSEVTVYNQGVPAY
jgi:hypothetical protein